MLSTSNGIRSAHGVSDSPLTAVAALRPSARGSAAPGVQAMERPSTQQITELKDLLDAGALTQAEFEAKKAELLQRL